MANDGIRIYKKHAFGIVADSVLTDKTLSLSTRAVLAYLVGRPNGWTIHISHLRQVLGISDTVWRRARLQLMQAGYLQQFRFRDPEGKIRWDISVSDTPIVKQSKSISDSDTNIRNPIDTSESDSDCRKEAQ